MNKPIITKGAFVTNVNTGLAFTLHKDMTVETATILLDDPAITQFTYKGHTYTTETKYVIFPNNGTISA
jgi:hypothetical protein